MPILRQAVACAVLGKESCNTLSVVKRMYQIKGYNSTDILNELEDLFNRTGLCNRSPSHLDKASDSSSKENSSGPEKDTERELKCLKVTESTEWVKYMVSIIKSNKISICIDP